MATDMRQTDASATHAANLQAYVASLKERLANPTKEHPASGPAGSSSTNTGPNGGSFTSTGPPGGLPGGAVAATSKSTLQNDSHVVYLAYFKVTFSFYDSETACAISNKDYTASGLIQYKVYLDCFF